MAVTAVTVIGYGGGIDGLGCCCCCRGGGCCRDGSRSKDLRLLNLFQEDQGHFLVSQSRLKFLYRGLTLGQEGGRNVLERERKKKKD
ncbi:Uncharacterized protein FKW44_013667 [Caligus rogercresseyi]|uniref:Uncharacterized protein n=1 Tax=Caligus rogercresseyi TaxID=217165 RepID=A0A7T8GXX2_CALRO|nr:Uncharacterized protein FKW44_013667 [Caligus rogercresseyi]